MTSLLLLFVFAVGGYTFRKTHWGSSRSARASIILNRWVIRVALPALVLSKIHGLPSLSLARPEVYLPVSQPWIQFGLSLLVMPFLARVMRWSRSTWGALVMTVGLGNTSFVGLPLLRAILGPESLPTGILQDQLGSFLILSMLGVPFAQMVAPSGKAGAKKESVLSLLMRPLKFPAFIALAVAVLTSGMTYPAWVTELLSLLAWTLSPAALLSVGMMLSFRTLKRREVRVPLLAGLLCKLLIFPALYLMVYPAWSEAVGGIPLIVLQTLLLEGAMASQITGGIIAADQGLEPELSRLMVGVSIPLSLITVPMWGWGIRSLLV